MTELVLGTAQFGSAYGLANRERRVSREAIAEILDLAWKSGVRVLDTAPVYGDAEQTLGELAAGRFALISKTNSKVDTVERSLRDLRVERLEALLVHQAQDLLGPDGERLFRKLESLKSTVGKIGVSVYKPETLDAILARYPIELVQLPVNLLNQSFVRSGMLAELAKRKVEVHARSVFLQGALGIDPAALPPRFQKVRKLLEGLRSAGGAALALAFVRDLGVDAIVVGVDSAAQLAEIVSAMKTGRAPADAATYAIDDPQIIDPSTWK